MKACELFFAGCCQQITGSKFIGGEMKRNGRTGNRDAGCSFSALNFFVVCSLVSFWFENVNSVRCDFLWFERWLDCICDASQRAKHQSLFFDYSNDIEYSRHMIEIDEQHVLSKRKTSIERRGGGR